MSEEMKNIPRRLRRFYRHGEPVPEEMRTEHVEREDDEMERNAQHVHEENEPWMNPQEKLRANTPVTRPTSSAPNSRRNMRNTGNMSTSNSPTASTSTSNTEPKPGLFSRILNKTQQPRVTSVDKALGLHDKQLFEENPPQASEQALKQNPPLSKSTRAQEEIQSALQEIRTLAKNSTNEEEKKSVSLTSFHFTPAGEIPRAPHENKDTIPASSSNSPASNLSPRERAEQRRQGKNIPQNVGPTSSSAASPSSLRDNPSTVNASNATTPSHVRRRMGQVVSDSMLPESARSENDHPFANEKESFSKGDEDFKSLFGEKNKDDKKKKKNTQDDDEDFSLDDEGEGLELLEDK